MACHNCPPNNGLPTSCGQVVVVQYQPSGASSPIPAWLEYNCDGEEPQLIFYADAELSEVIEGASVDEIVGIGTGINGTSCADSTKVDLCPDTLDAVHDMFVEQTAELREELDETSDEIVAAIEAQTTSINANIDVEIQSQTNTLANAISTQTTAINNNIDAEVQAQTAALLLAINREYDSLGAPLPVGFQGLPKTSTYTTEGLLDTITVVSGTSTYVKTFTYTGSNQTGDSGWVLQP